SDKKENVIPKLGLIHFIDPESGKDTVVDTSDRRFQLWFTSQRLALEEERKAQFLKSKLDSILVSTSESYIKPLVNFFRMRERRW
ncbi:MAG: DUF58 domain-containing protein, partial [Ignavibacteria bacterium]|nr:DUF58 domain-containing protein [Ignavibacteria bacterium]